MMTIDTVLEEVRCLRRELRSLSERLDTWEACIKTLDKKKKNAVRREQYKEERRRREEGLLALPDRPVLNFKNGLLAPRFAQWAQAGMRFAAADQPGPFVTWLVHQWNSCTYLKKPITFSGSSFRVWNGHTRCAYGPRDLMHFSERHNSMPPLRNPAEHDDFRGRPWWDWGYSVLFAVYDAMLEQGNLPERFQNCLALLIGGFASYEVLPGVCWDFNESRENLNKMLRRVGTDLQCMLRAVYTGLRVKNSESPVPVP
jgi:hypothetical protein